KGVVELARSQGGSLDGGYEADWEGEEQEEASALAPAGKLAPGIFLLQHPLSQDSCFDRAVVLIYDYSPQTGALGLIVNKPQPMTFGSAVSFSMGAEATAQLRPSGGAA
ncbi:unnamed protein product, partial [Heterosigma akashiwo]